MMKIDIEKVKSLMNETAFLDQASECKSIEELTALYHANGVELSSEQVQGLLKAAEDSLTTEEISEADLDDVVGGASVWSTIKKCFGAFKKGWEWGNKFFEWEQSLYK